MRARQKGREELVECVQQALALPTKKEAEHVANTVIASLETTLLDTAIKITPAQTLLILRSVMGNMLHFSLLLVVATTALRSSEVLSLGRADILWEERKIRIVKSWKNGSGRRHEDTILGARCPDR
jgi:integrase